MLVTIYEWTNHYIMYSTIGKDCWGFESKGWCYGWEKTNARLFIGSLKIFQYRKSAV